MSQQEYDAQLRQCHFVYAPLQKEFREESPTPEQYGLTKSSGCFFDAIRFAKPILLDASIHLPDEIKQQAIIHHSPGELADFIKNLHPEMLKSLQARAVENSRQFSLPEVRQKLQSVLVAL